MLTKVTVHSQWTNVDPLELNVVNRPDTDLFEVRNIDGLGPVKADVSTARLGSVSGEAFMGSSTGKRNIVLTLGLTPDWDEWTMSRLRRNLDQYFMPEQQVRLVLETQEFSPVEISGYIEANEPQIFSKDPEHQISIICPNLYFQSVDPVVMVGTTDESARPIEYEGNVETGIVLDVERPSYPGPTIWYKATVRDPLDNYLELPARLVSDDSHWVMSSVPGDKYVRQIRDSDQFVTSLLNTIEIVDENDRKSRWPMLGPGSIDFDVTTNNPEASDWTLTYYNRFGSL